VLLLQVLIAALPRSDKIRAIVNQEQVGGQAVQQQQDNSMCAAPGVLWAVGSWPPGGGDGEVSLCAWHCA